MTTDDAREAARKQIKTRREFWSLSAILVVVGIFLVVIWWVTGAPHYFWPAWPLIAFVLAIVFSGLNAFGVLNREVTEADIDAHLARKNRGGAA
jgi:membrane protein YdbS with pleckstrin-like domain